MINNVRFFVVCGLIIYFYFIVKMVRKRKLSLNHAIPWLVVGMVMTIFDIFPLTLTWISEILGVQVPLNAFLIVSILFIFIELIFFTANVSTLSGKIVKLTQENAILEKRVRELEDDCNYRGKNNNDEQ